MYSLAREAGRQAGKDDRIEIPEVAYNRKGIETLSVASELSTLVRARLGF